MRTAREGLIIVCACVVLLACPEVDPIADAGEDAGAPGPASAIAAYDRPEEHYSAPWPDERLRGSDGLVRVAAFPNPRGVRIVRQLVTLLDGVAGFATSATLFFPLSAPIDPASLPSDGAASLRPDATVFLVDVDPDSPDLGARSPLVPRFTADPGPFGAPNLLALLPLQGRPLAHDRLYAAVVTTDVRGGDGSPLGAAEAAVAVRSGTRPEGMSEATFAAHRAAFEVLEGSGDADRVAALAVFRTWDPMAELADARDQLLAAPSPAPSEDFVEAEVFDDFCVYRATIEMPDHQAGAPPYEAEGGGWARDAAGDLEVQRAAASNLWLTLPRRAMPAGGFPLAVFVRTGGGGDRPLVDRGVRAEPGVAGPAGEGPATHFARAGVAGLSVDGPLGGLRNEGGWDEQFAIFNINNPVALRDSVRQSALELTLVPRIAESIAVDGAGCPGLSTDAGDSVVRFDLSRLAIMGHSMGATIAPLAVALEPRYRAMILSGAGASWIDNVIYKESPLRVSPAAESLLQYSAQGRRINEHDPVLALLQWAGEPADPQVYARAVIEAPREGEPRHVLMFQGVLDTYIPPPVANALSLSLGLDLAGGGLDETVTRFAPLTPLLPLAGRSSIALPASGNRFEGAVTGVVVQHLEDGVEDGHEVVFQRAEPQHQYRCFLQTLTTSDAAPVVIARDATTCP